MFIPNTKCRVQITSGETDVFGQPKPGRWVTERCSIVRLKIVSGKTALRAERSASEGAANELQSTAVVQLTTRTGAQIDDILELQGYQFKITSRQPMFDAAGKLDHYEVNADIWRKT